MENKMETQPLVSQEVLDALNSQPEALPDSSNKLIWMRSQLEQTPNGSQE
jgi:hypothetical protein